MKRLKKAIGLKLIALLRRLLDSFEEQGFVKTPEDHEWLRKTREECGLHERKLGSTASVSAPGACL